MTIKEWIDAGMPWNSFVCGDCMEGMKEFPDNYFDLAIVDPPYGIGINKGGYTLAGLGNFQGGNFGIQATKYPGGEWDKERPKKEYFIKLFRISKNQIIWGGNYFADLIPVSSGWITWDKDNGESYQGDCELAWTSFNKAVRKVRWRWHGVLQQNMKFKEKRIHPTQKPVFIYRWLLKNYAQAGWKILDTHVGSASSLIACQWEGFDYIGFEKDKDYYEAATKRIEDWRKGRTLDLFERKQHGTI